MSSAHLFPSADGLVAKALRGIIAYNPALRLDTANRVVYDSAYDRSKVVLISGGGSGHEPAWSGYVGTNMLGAAVAGDIFASPSTKQILAAVAATATDAGTILVITNYTGDCLHFGLAAEKAIAAGHRCRVIVCGDDVSVGRSGGSLVGRRGLAGQIAVLKVMGGAAGAGGSLDDVYGLGQAVARQIVSIAATLDHCHVPGRSTDSHGALAADEIELGTGPHNEPGYRKLQPAPSAAELVATMLRHCLDESDADRAYVHFGAGDDTVLAVSNFGGMSPLEMGALVDELLGQLDRDWHMQPVRVYCGCLETSLNAPAFSVSVINLTAAAADPECPYSVDEMKQFLDVRTSTSWEAVAGAQGGGARPPRSEQVVSGGAAAETDSDVDVGADTDTGLLDPKQLEQALRKGCEALVEAEPDLTRWDTVMGDGDCGETLKTGALALLAALEPGEPAGAAGGLAAGGSALAVLRALEGIVENKMGGTLGGILGILLVALRTAMEQQQQKKQGPVSADVWATALTTALGQLGHYTPAKVGDRTVLDALLPFAKGLHDGGLAAAVAAAEAGAQATRSMKPKLGRATYVAAGKTAGHGSDLPPDPGAWGIMVALRGFYQGWIGE